jgi:hypothetical protein
MRYIESAIDKPVLTHRYDSSVLFIGRAYMAKSAVPNTGLSLAPLACIPAVVACKCGDVIWPHFTDLLDKALQVVQR